MKIFKTVLIAGILFFLSICCKAQLAISAALCENKINPSGIDISDIHFSWELQSKVNDQYQTAYQIVIATSKEKLAAANYDMWNSTIVKSSQSIQVKYAGKKMKSGEKYYWQVRVWDKNNKPSLWSKMQQFSTGVITDSDWENARWIGYEQLPDSMRIVPGIHAPFVSSLGNKCLQRSVAPLFRKQFIINKKVRTALLFITGVGQYKADINGEKIGNAFLSPGWTYFDKTILYNVYDVTNRVTTGANVIGVVVGNGFYNINRERYFKLVTAFGFPAMRCRLKILFEDGSEKNIVSDDTWKTSPSAITFTSIYGGEDYNAQLEQRGWNTSSFNDNNWKNALLVEAPRGKLMAEQDYPIEIMDSFKVKKIWHPADSICMYDFGQNASGIVRIKVRGKKGQVIKLYPAELLNEKHLANQSASGEPYILSYMLKGDGEEIWQPLFTYYGFRYVQVNGAAPDTAKNISGLPVIVEMKALHNRNSNPTNGSFECSNKLFNRIYTLINWAIKSNVQSVVTDCPHREKLGWLEQDYLMGNSIHYNYDVYSLYKKLVNDMIDAQYNQGFVPDIAPRYVVFDGGFLDSPEWGSASVIVPWLLYTWYGDVDVLKKAYPMMKRYASYLESKSVGHILSHGLGDWFDYGPNSPGEAQLTPKSVTATAIYYYDVSLLNKIAVLLNYKEDAAMLTQQATAIKTAFNNKFFNAVNNTYSTGSQTAMAMPYCVGLADEKNKPAVLKNLVDSIYAGNKALTAGDIGFHFLVQALDMGGASQLIYDMNNRDDVPGYGFQLKKGATTLTESWPALENVSNNHLMLGHIMEWFYSGLAGITQDDNSIAFRNIKIRPQVVGDINAVKGSFHSPYGWIKSEWKKSKDKMTMNVQIPPNTVADVFIPVKSKFILTESGKRINYELKNDKALVHIGSGTYHFKIDYL